MYSSAAGFPMPQRGTGNGCASEPEQPSSRHVAPRCARGMVVFLGTRRQLVDGVEMTPWWSFSGTAGVTMCVAHPGAAHARVFHGPPV